MNREGNLTMISDYRNNLLPGNIAAKAVQSGDCGLRLHAGFPSWMDAGALAGAQRGIERCEKLRRPGNPPAPELKS